MLLGKKNNSTWSKLSVQQLQAVMEVPQEFELIDMAKSVTAIVDSKSLDDVEEMDLDDLLKRYAVIRKELNQEPFKPFKFYVKLDGKRYYICRMFDEFSTAQWVDFAHFTKNPENSIPLMHEIVATCLREVNWIGNPKKYDGAKHKEKADLVRKHMKAVDALGVSGFFLLSYLSLSETLEQFLSKQKSTEI
jgi:hypothetical protein